MDPAGRLNEHIRTNAVKSALLIAGFPLVVPTVVASLVLILGVIFGARGAPAMAGQTFLTLLLAMIVVTLVWLPVGYAINQWIIDRATGARLLERHEEPRLWSLHESLCAGCGMRLPALRIIDTEVMNAYASGLGEGRYSVTVTRGLLDSLTDDELEAVLAHELTHIRNHDVRLLVVATVLVGMIPILHDIVMRVFWVVVMGILNIYRAIFTAMRFPLAKLFAEVGYFGMFWMGKAFAFVIGVVAHISSLMIHFALSRRREFMADAGAVAMTGKPEAMIAALRRISGCSTLETEITGVRAMLFDSPAVFSLGGLFDTHPPIEARIAALERHAIRSYDRHRGPEPLLAQSSETMGKRPSTMPEDMYEAPARGRDASARHHDALPPVRPSPHVRPRTSDPSLLQDPPDGPELEFSSPHQPPPDLVQRFQVMLQTEIGERRLSRDQRVAIYRKAWLALDTHLAAGLERAEEAATIQAALKAAMRAVETAYDVSQS